MRTLSILVVVAIVAPAASFSQDYLPLSVGSHWQYLGVSGEQETQTVTGTVSLWGEEAWVIRYSESTNNDGLENYWSTAADGDVLVWGWWRSPDSWGYLYNPPIKMLDSPLFVGKSWEQTVAYFSLPDTLFVDSLDIAYQVFEEGVVITPAGSYASFGIGQIIPSSPFSSNGYTLLGASAGLAKDEEATNWWSSGVGQVQYQTTDLYQLASYGSSTSTAEASWGQIKQLFQ